ncbi:MAG: hypothetical protein ABSC01_06400 [Verrucomicrobiota bacterium]|jgi:hypothetical protein
MNSAQNAIAGYNRLNEIFNRESADGVTALSATPLQAGPRKVLTNSDIIMILLGEDDGVTTLSSGLPFTGFKVSKKILQLE